MSDNQWKVSAAVTGIANTSLGPRQYANRSAVSVASEVVAEALKDAGLQRSQIDGLCVHIGSPRGTDYDVLAAMLGLNVRFAAQPWSHGRFTASVITHAAMALSCGMANYVLCVAAYRNSNEGGRHGTKERASSCPVFWSEQRPRRFVTRTPCGRPTAPATPRRPEEPNTTRPVTRRLVAAIALKK